MNNFGSENMGVLLHKLTKYQTLLANCGAPSKAAVYNQKIDYYSRKLNGMGVSQNNIKSMRNLIGGVGSQEEEAREEQIRELDRLMTEADQTQQQPVEFDMSSTSGYEIAIEDALNQITQAHNTNIQKMEELTTLKNKADQDLVAAQQEIANLNQIKSDLETKIAEHIANITAITGELGQARTNLADRDAAITAQAAKAQEALGKIQDLEGRVAQLEQQKADIQAEKDAMQTERDGLVQKLATLNGQFDRLFTKCTGELQTLKGKIGGPGRRIRAPSGNLSALQARLNAVRDSIQQGVAIAPAPAASP